MAGGNPPATFNSGETEMKKETKRFYCGIGYSWYAERERDKHALRKAGLSTFTVFDSEKEAKDHAALVLEKTGVQFKISPSY